MKIFDWIKSNKLSSFLLFFIALSIFTYYRNSYTPYYGSRLNYSESSIGYDLPKAGGGDFAALESASYDDYEGDYIETSSPRMITQNASLSLLVKNIKDTSEEIIDYTQKAGGFMVNSSISNPDISGTGYLTINVPSEKLDETLEYLSSISVKVVSESLTGRDITDQYQDIESRLSILKSNKARFEEIMNQTEKTSEILDVQRQIFSLQDQIDNLIGRKEYLEEKAQYSQISIDLATDELSLPYAPDNKWRPIVVFKNAVRSLLKLLQRLGNLAIYLVVFSVIIVPAYFIYKLIRKLINKKKI